MKHLKILNPSGLLSDTFAMRYVKGFTLIETLVSLGISALIMLGGSYVMVAAFQQQSRSEQVKKQSDLAQLIRQSVIEQKNVRSGKCTTAFRLKDAAFDLPRAATRQGVPIVLRNLVGFNRDLQVHASAADNNYEGYGYITELSFANARSLGSASNYIRDDISQAQVRTDVYIGDIYLGIKRNQQDAKDRRVYVGTLAININSSTNAFHSCTLFGGAEEDSICASLGDNVEYDEELQRCRVRVGLKRVQPGQCAADERMFVNAYGEIECQKFIVPTHCGYRQGTGEPQLMRVIWNGMPNCEGAPRPQFAQASTMNNRYCGVVEVMVEAFAQCISSLENSGLYNLEAYDRCLIKYPNVFSIMGRCDWTDDPNDEDGEIVFGGIRYAEAPNATIAQNRSEVAPPPGSCRCDDQIISAGQNCIICSPVGTYVIEPSPLRPWIRYNFGSTLYTFQCVAGALRGASAVAQAMPCAAPSVAQ